MGIHSEAKGIRASVSLIPINAPMQQCAMCRIGCPRCVVQNPDNNNPCKLSMLGKQGLVCMALNASVDEVVQRAHRALHYTVHRENHYCDLGAILIRRTAYDRTIMHNIDLLYVVGLDGIPKVGESLIYNIEKQLLFTNPDGTLPDSVREYIQSQVDMLRLLIHRSKGDERS